MRARFLSCTWVISANEATKRRSTFDAVVERRMYLLNLSVPDASALATGGTLSGRLAERFARVLLCDPSPSELASWDASLTQLLPLVNAAVPDAAVVFE